MKANISILFLSLFFLTLPAFGQYQKKRQLQQQKKTLYQQISSTEKMLNQTRQQHKNSLQELHLLEEQIANRQRVIQNIRAEISTLNTHIGTANQQIDSLKTQLDNLQTAYANTIRQAYLEQNPYNKLQFLFSSKSFNDAYRRFKYVQYYSDYRKQQFHQVQSTKDTLTHKRNDLEQKKTEKETLLGSEEDEKQQLQKEEAAKSALIAELQKKTDDLEEQVTTQQQAAQTLEQELQVVIQEIARREAEERARKEQQRKAAEARAKKEAARKRAIEETARKEAKRAATAAAKKAAQEKARKATAARKAAEEKAKKAATARKAAEKKATEVKAKKATTKAAPKVGVDGDALTKSFANKKGKLIWPVVKGVITSRFGRNRHPILKHITTTNNGIDISTYKAATVRALYNGTVSNILYNPSFHWAVIVKHGTYFTVYSNLSKVTVKKDALVKPNQVLGVVHHNVKASKSEVHLEIWKGSQKLNPVYWLQRR